MRHGRYLDGLKMLYPYPDQLSKHGIQVLKRLKLSVFKDPIPPVAYEHGAGDWIIKGGWRFDGIYRFDLLNLYPPDHYILGSWSGTDQNTGSIHSKPFRVDSPVSVTIPVIHGPDISNQKIGVKIDIEPAELLCEFNSNPHRWSLCQLDLAPYVGKEMIIFAEDKGMDELGLTGAKYGCGKSELIPQYP